MATTTDSHAALIAELQREREVNRSLAAALEGAWRALSTPGHGPRYAAKILESALALAEKGGDNAAQSR